MWEYFASVFFQFACFFLIVCIYRKLYTEIYFLFVASIVTYVQCVHTSYWCPGVLLLCYRTLCEHILFLFFWLFSLVCLFFNRIVWIYRKLYFCIKNILPVLVCAHVFAGVLVPNVRRWLKIFWYVKTFLYFSLFLTFP